MRAALFASSLLALWMVPGCGKGRTEAVVIVTASGLRIPDDIDAIHVQVYDAQQPTPALWDASYTLCNSTVSTGCVSLPFTMTLIPGSVAVTDSTRVVISAQRAQVDRIDDAAIFTFAKDESLRLDFVLYANCLDKVDCAALNQVCGPRAICVPLKPTPFKGEPDLAPTETSDLGAPGHDLAVAGDMTGGGVVDLQMSHDLKGSPDLHPVCGCPAGFCGRDACGNQCGCNPNELCSGTLCTPCGSPGDQCCPNDVCNGQSTCNLNNTMCECGDLGQPCCAPNDTCNNITLGCVQVGPGMKVCQAEDMGTPPPPDQLLATWDRQTFTGGPPPPFSGVSGAGGLVVAVGSNGNIWKLGTTPNQWVKMPSNGAGNTTGNFRRVWMSANNNGDAVGDAGLIDHWDGGSWTVQVNPFNNSASYYITGVWTNAAELWVSGGGAGTGVVAHKGTLTGGTWSLNAGAISYGGVFSDGSAQALLAFTDSQQYRATDSGASIVLSSFAYAGTTASSSKVWGDTLGSAWFVSGNGDVVYFNGTTLSSDLASQTGVQLTAIHGFGSGATVDLWAVGFDGAGGMAPVLYHALGPPPHVWTAQSMTALSAAANSSFSDVVALGPRDLYLVGNENGAPLIVHAHSP